MSITENVHMARQKINAAAESVGRSGSEVRLLAATKMNGPEAVQEAIIRAPCAGYFTAAADGTMSITSGGWSFTAPLNEKTAARLPGDDRAELLLPDGTRVTAALRLTDDGEAIFSCDTHLESVLTLGECTLTVLLAKWQGFSVPGSAVTSGEDGDGVYRVSGPVREYVPVTVLARRNGFALVASPMLRGGMTVLLFPAAEAAS